MERGNPYIDDKGKCTSATTWVQYFRVGNSGKSFNYVKDWLTKKIRRHIMRSKKRGGFGWKRWSNKELYGRYKIYSDFHLVSKKAVLT
jgi:RNA-directed DNA polymerase